jgi:Bacterial Ig-like domain
MSDNKSSEIPGKKVSYNSRAVLLGLFALVGFTLAVYTYSVNVFPPEQSGRLNTVFIAAISGTLALGGTLISQLWGTSTKPAAPSIYATDPADTANGVSLDTSIRASFNMVIDKSTVNSNTFTLKDDTNSDISGTITLEGGNAILKPLGDLKPATKYTAKISKDVKSITGDSLEGDKEWSFTTKSVT